MYYSGCNSTKMEEEFIYLSLPILSQSLSSTCIESVLANSLPAKSKAKVYNNPKTIIDR